MSASFPRLQTRMLQLSPALARKIAATIAEEIGAQTAQVQAAVRTLTDDLGRFLPPDELRQVLQSAGVDGETPVATYCGSGVQASHVSLAISLAGLGEGTPVYIGSWSDWISDPSRPVAVGADSHQN